MKMFMLLFQKILRPPPSFSPSYNAATKTHNEKRAGAHSNWAFCLSGENRVLSELNRPLSELNRPCRSWVLSGGTTLPPLSYYKFSSPTLFFFKFYSHDLNHPAGYNKIWIFELIVLSVQTIQIKHLIHSSGIRHSFSSLALRYIHSRNIVFKISFLRREHLTAWLWLYFATGMWFAWLECHHRPQK